MAEKYGEKVRKLMVKEMTDVFSQNEGFIFSSMENIKATQADTFRKKIKQSGSRHLIVKNRLAVIALKEAGISELVDTVKESKIMGVTLIKDDPVQTAKLLMEFSKSNKGFKVSNGYLDGNVLTSERIKELSELPGREQLIAMVVGMVLSPISNFVGVTASMLRSILFVLKAIIEKKEESVK